MGQSESTNNSSELQVASSGGFGSCENLTTIISIGLGERLTQKKNSASMTPLKNTEVNPQVPDKLQMPIVSPGKGSVPAKYEDPPMSEYTVDDIILIKDDGSAPLNYEYRYGDVDTSDNTKKGLCNCCKKNKEARVLDGDNTRILRSCSRSDLIGARGGELNSGSNAGVSVGAGDDSVIQEEKLKVKIRQSTQQRRTRIPRRPDINLSLWSIIKTAIGKDLTKLPLPVNFNEPLSMLQRLTEDFEYSKLIDQAAECNDSLQQMTYVVAFTVSAYATSALRTGKPFNPLLGETYECDRTQDLGWRCINEQVSHHPPLVAQFCEGKNWECWQQFSMSSKFKGNSIEIVPLGISHLSFQESGNHYTWRKVPSVVHNIMLGKLWIDQEGEMDVFNHTTKDSCHITYTPTSFFRGDAKRVEGTVYNKDKVPKVFLRGFWDQKMEAFDIVRVNKDGRFTLGKGNLLWTRNMPSPDSEKYYNFTILACQLNEMEGRIAPTDSRYRPDQRLMENGYFDEANVQKLRLEDKQRSVRKLRMTLLAKEVPGKSKSSVATQSGNDSTEPGYTPAWFAAKRDNITGKLTHVYQGEYWQAKENQDWARCPDIF